MGRKKYNSQQFESVSSPIDDKSDLDADPDFDDFKQEMLEFKKIKLLKPPQRLPNGEKYKH